jgi:osmotically inducible lipoprotein OsmB
MRKFTIVIAAVALLSACAQRPLTTQEKGAVTGAAIGAGAGALIGSATGKAGTGAAIGAGVGLLTGAIVGGAVENERAQAGYPPPSPAVTPPPQPQASASTPAAPTVDPTAGQFVNSTRWRLEIFVDSDPQATQSASVVLLNPQEARQFYLDLGPHRVIAQATVDTQFGTRTVGRYDRTIQVDPRGSGWTLRFTESDFR